LFSSLLASINVHTEVARSAGIGRFRALDLPDLQKLGRGGQSPHSPHQRAEGSAPKAADNAISLDVFAGLQSSFGCMKAEAA
jgi:hypothetical protein